MTFAEVVRMTRAYAWFIVLCILLGIGAMVAKTSQEPVLYSAGASGFIKVGNATSAAEELGNGSLAEEKANLYVVLVRTTPVAERVIDMLGLDVDPSTIAGRFSASVDTDVNLLSVQAIGTTPEEARDLANTVIEAVRRRGRRRSRTPVVPRATSRRAWSRSCPSRRRSCRAHPSPPTTARAR